MTNFIKGIAAASIIAMSATTAHAVDTVDPTPPPPTTSSSSNNDGALIFFGLLVGAVILSQIVPDQQDLSLERRTVAPDDCLPKAGETSIACPD